VRVIVLVFLAVGIAAGILVRRHPRLVRAAGRLGTAAVCLLVFLLGVAVGSNPTVVRNLAGLGLQATVLGLAGVLGSAAAARLVASRVRPRAK